MYCALCISSVPTTTLEGVVDGEAHSCGGERVDDDLPATEVMTASAGSRSFWANIVTKNMLFSNFSNVSTAQLNGLTPAAAMEDVEKRVETGCCGLLMDRC
jgi:hypothetical protein